MKQRNKGRNIKKGSRVSLYINESASDNLVEWLNNQVYLGPIILNILDEYVNNRLVDMETIKGVVDSARKE